MVLTTASPFIGREPPQPWVQESAFAKIRRIMRKHTLGAEYPHEIHVSRRDYDEIEAWFKANRRITSYSDFSMPFCDLIVYGARIRCSHS